MGFVGVVGALQSFVLLMPSHLASLVRRELWSRMLDSAFEAWRCLECMELHSWNPAVG
jgi:hypothetical protein